MARKRNPNIPDKQQSAPSGYTYLDRSTAEKYESSNMQIGRAIDSIQPVMRSMAFNNVTTPSLTARQGLSQFDYEIFRPGERKPFQFRAIMQACMSAYERISIVRNVIDLMGDFTSQGIKIVHPDPSIEQFYQNWWKQINGNHISERFANSFYMTGNPIVRRNMAKVKSSILEGLRKGFAAASESAQAGPFSLFGGPDFNDEFFHDYDQIPEKPETPVRNLIPWEYDFLNPLYVSLIGGDLALFSGQKTYGLDIPKDLAATISAPRGDVEIGMVAAIPDYIKNPILNGSSFIPLDPSRVSVYHYKKHSWQAWAFPILYAVMDELIILQKLKMADLAALDGACSHIRVWKLGNIQAELFPTPEIIQKLSDILSHAGNGQALEVIWGPDIDLIETKTDFAHILGKEKYIPTLESIYAGLGIPPSLTGVGGAGGGSVNSFLSLKTLIERLNYGRDALTRFWDKEIKIVQRALGFPKPARIEFKNMILTDDASQNQILIHLLDRDVISLERVREHFGYIPEVEEATIKKEYKDREKKKIPPKVSAFHDANPDLSLEKIFAQNGSVTPGQLGIELDPKGADEVSGIDLQVKNQTLQEDQFAHQKKVQNTQTKQSHQLNMQKQKDDTSVKKLAIKNGVDPNSPPPGEAGQGRPKNSVDTEPRKKRTTKASADFINLQLWAKAAQDDISELVNPIFLKKCNKKNMRSLGTAEIEEVEQFKWVILCNLKPYEKITKASLGNLINTHFPANTECDNYWKVCVASHVAKTGVAPTIDEIKQIQAYIYALTKGDENGESYD